MAKTYALLGHPIDGSPSPAMQNAAFRELGIEAKYILRPTGAADAVEVLRDIQAGKLAGANITTPLKTVLAPHVPLWGAASRAGAVNTLWWDGETLVGALTDVDGIAGPLVGAKAETGGAGLVIGSGGAARAAVLALEAIDATVHLAARNLEAGEDLMAHLAPARAGHIVPLDAKRELGALFPDLSIIIQATPVGRQGDRHELPWDRCIAGPIAFDMTYRPRRTPFLDDAAAVGCHTIEGWEMLAGQGAASFTLWTGTEAPIGLMRKVVQAHLADPGEPQPQ